MKAAITIICFALTGTTGCFAAQYDAINNEANNHMHALDSQCKQDMTEWCRTQYMLVQRQREQELNDLEARRHHAAQLWQQSWSPRHGRTCTTQVVGDIAYTSCR